MGERLLNGGKQRHTSVSSDHIEREPPELMRQRSGAVAEEVLNPWSR